MTAHLINEYTSSNLGDAVIYETLVQLLSPLKTCSHMAQAQYQTVRGLQGIQSPQANDVYVSVGGDIFNNARPRFVTRRFLQNLHALHTRPADQTLLFGQSIPDSCQGLSFKLLCHVLRGLSSVTVRDPLSHQRLLAAGVKAHLSYDLAFGYATSPQVIDAGQWLFDSLRIDAERCALISVRSFNHMYPHDNAKFRSKIAQLCVNLARRGHVPAILLQSDAQGTDSDRAVIADLKSIVPKLKVVNPFAKGAPFHAIDLLIGALTLANSVLAVRYHASILRILAGRQAYNLHYSVKGQQLTDQLGLPGVGIEAFDVDLALRGLEASAQTTFDPSEQRRHVREAFTRRLCAALKSNEDAESLQLRDKPEGSLLSNRVS